MSPTRKIKRRKPAAARREVMLHVMATKEERALFQAAAARVGTSVSTWLRQAGLYLAREPWPTFVEVKEPRAKKSPARAKRRD